MPNRSSRLWRLDIQLSGGQLITEGSNDLLGEEVEHEPEGDGDGQGGQGPPEQGQADQGEAEPNEDGHKAGQGGVPVTVAAGL